MRKIVDLRSVSRPVNLSNRQEKLDRRKKDILEKQEELRRKTKELLRRK